MHASRPVPAFSINIFYHAPVMQATSPAGGIFHLPDNMGSDIESVIVSPGFLMFLNGEI